MTGERFAIVPVRLLEDRHVTPAVGWTYAALASFADRDRVARPGWRALAELRGVDKGTLGRHLAELIRLGHIERERSPGWVGRSHVQGYRLIHNQTDRGAVSAPISYPEGARTATRNARDLLHAPLIRNEQRGAEVEGGQRGVFLPGSGWIP